MPRDLAIRCKCGALQGVARDVAPETGTYLVCHCDDCQAFAHFLARAPDILDAHGGTRIFQMSPAKFAITAGADQLACMRLTPAGMLRWYARCCNTPIGNTMASNKLPFVGLIDVCIRKPQQDPSLEAALGPVQMHGFRRFAKGDPAAIPADRLTLFRLVPRFAGLMLRWTLRGDRKRSPFFEAASGRPVAAPHVLSPTERDQLRRAVGQPVTP